MKKKIKNNFISLNKKAKHSYFIEKKIEAGLCLQGWEVKSLRKKQINIENSYIVFRNKEVFLFGSRFNPVTTLASHMRYDLMRDRKILLHKKEINFLYGKMSREKYVVIVLSLFWKKAWCKVVLGLAKGKSKYDKRKSAKEREWNRQKEKLLKNNSKF